MSKEDEGTQSSSLDDVITHKMFYQVPIYQRSYSWKNDNLEKLIEDLLTAYEKKDNEYFCGSIVLVKNKTEADDEENDRYDIIDGQQRLTTFIILACVFRYSALYDSLNNKAKDYIEESIHERGNEKKYRLLTSNDLMQQNSFKESVLEGIDWTGFERKRIDYYSGKKPYLKNALRLRKIIEDKKKERNLKDEDINNFVLYIYKKVLMNVIKCRSEDNAIKIFDVLNNRSMPLTPADILKSSLMQQLSSNTDQIEFDKAWKDIFKNFDDDKKFNDFLGVLAYYYEGTRATDRIDKTLLKNIEKNNLSPSSFIIEMTKFYKHYKYLHNDKDDKDRYIYLLRYLKDKNNWSAVMTGAYFANYSDIEKLKQYLVALYYQNWIAGLSDKKLLSISSSILKKVKNGDSINNIKEEIKNYIIINNIATTYKNNLESSYIGEDNDTLCKALLAMVEYFMVDEKDFIKIKSQGCTHLEHILPQKPTDEWREYFNEEEIKKCKNALGNLTLLSSKTNRELQNFSFAKKKKIYINNRREERSSFAITQDVAANEKWNAEIIEKRTKKLIAEINKVIDFDRF